MFALERGFAPGFVAVPGSPGSGGCFPSPQSAGGFVLKSIHSHGPGHDADFDAGICSLGCANSPTRDDDPGLSCPLHALVRAHSSQLPFAVSSFWHCEARPRRRARGRGCGAERTLERELDEQPGRRTHPIDGVGARVGRVLGFENMPAGCAACACGGEDLPCHRPNLNVQCSGSD